MRNGAALSMGHCALGQARLSVESRLRRVNVAQEKIEAKCAHGSFG
jgi:hypothetical protein